MHGCRRPGRGKLPIAAVVRQGREQHVSGGRTGIKAESGQELLSESSMNMEKNWLQAMGKIFIVHESGNLQYMGREIYST